MKLIYSKIVSPREALHIFVWSKKYDCNPELKNLSRHVAILYGYMNILKQNLVDNAENVGLECM